MDSEIFEGDEAVRFVQEYTPKSIGNLKQAVGASPDRCLRFLKALMDEAVFEIDGP